MRLSVAAPLFTEAGRAFNLLLAQALEAEVIRSTCRSETRRERRRQTVQHKYFRLYGKPMPSLQSATVPRSSQALGRS